jgi:hypothetical protein
MISSLIKSSCCLAILKTDNYEICEQYKKIFVQKPCNHGNQGTFFTAGQNRHRGGHVTTETRASSLLQSKNDLKALLALGIKHLWIYFAPTGRFL